MTGLYASSKVFSLGQCWSRAVELFPSFLVSRGQKRLVLIVSQLSFSEVNCCERMRKFVLKRSAGPNMPAMMRFGGGYFSSLGGWL